MSHKKAVLLIGYDSNLSLGVIYCLRSFNYTIHLLTSNQKNAARHSRFLDKIHVREAINSTDDIIKIVQENHIDLIMPIDEIEIRFIRQHKELLSQYAPCSWSTDTEFFDIGINKKLLAEFLTKNGVSCPVYATVNDLKELENIAGQIGYPLLLKPTRGSFGRMIRKFENWEDLKDYYNSNPPEDREFIIQPFIVGSDITCNVICKEGEIICYTIQESPVKTGSDFSSNDVLQFHEDEEVIREVGKMMKLLHWSGVACVDLRRDQRDKKVYILEINGRFWASVVTSCLKAKVNFPLIMLKLALNEPVDIPKQTHGRQIALKQYFDALKSGKKTSFKDTKYVSYLSDPVARFFQVFKL